MPPPPDVPRYLGPWRWLVANDSIVVGGELAELFGVDPFEDREGVKFGRLAQLIVPEDQASFHGALGRASHFGGDIKFSCRVAKGGKIHRLEVSGSCVRAWRGGRPAEYLGAAHLYEQPDEHPLSAAADHLASAARLARDLSDQSLSLFINMALIEAGSRLAELQKDQKKSRRRLALIN